MSERSAVQEPMLRYADEIGWQAISPSEAMQMRDGNTAVLYFTDVLKTQLLKLNQGIVDDSNCADVMRSLGLLSATLEGNQEALLWMRGEKPTFVASENRNRNVTLIDFGNPDNNLFHVTDEWEQQNAAHRNRADVVFLINGIPVAIVEAKNAGKPDGLALSVLSRSAATTVKRQRCLPLRNSSVSHNSLTSSTAWRGTPAEKICSIGKQTNLPTTNRRSKPFSTAIASSKYYSNPSSSRAETTTSPKSCCVNTRRVQWRR